MKQLLEGLRRHGGCVLAILAAVALTYGLCLDHYFLKDDLSMSMFTDSEGRFHWGSFVDQLLWPKGRTWDDIWRPIPAITWAIDYVFFGPSPVAFHFGNVVAHAGSGLLLYAIILSFSPTRRRIPALLGSLFFLLSPLHPEAILWCTQRTVVFGFFFSLLAILAYAGWLEHRTRGRLFLAFSATVLGTLSREHAIGLPAVFGFMALFGPGSRPFGIRIRDVLKAAAFGALWIAIYFGCRYLIFGRFTGGYSGWDSMDAYARDLRIFEDLPTTIRALLIPVNRLALSGPHSSWFPISADQVFFGVQIAFYGLVLWSMVRSPSRKTFYALSLALVVAATAWLPVLKVFKVFPSLLNSRSGYHIMGLFYGVTAASAAGAFSRLPANRLRIALTISVLVAHVLVLARHLEIYREGSAQVKGLQEETVALARAASPPKPILVFDVPTEHLGCPTMDAYLRDAVRPPYVIPGVKAVACVAGLQETWATTLVDLGHFNLSRTGTLTPNDSFLYCRAHLDRPYVRPLFSDSPAQPDGEAINLVEPIDGSILLSEAPSPRFLVETRPGIAAGVLVVQAAALELRYAVPLENGVGSLNIADSKPVGMDQPIQWPPPKEAIGSYPLPIRWWFEVVPSPDAPFARSQTRHLVLIHGVPRAKQ